MTMTAGAPPSANGSHEEAPQDGYSYLKGLDYTPTISFPGDGNGSNGDDKGYSAFIHEQGRILNTLYGVLMQGHITSELELLLIKKLFRLFRREWESEACNRQGRYDGEELLALQWQKRMGPEGQTLMTIAKGSPVDDWVRALFEDQLRFEDEDVTELAVTIDDLLAAWNTGASYIMEVRVQKKLHGLAHVQDHRDNVERARGQMEAARFAAARLAPAQNQYFWCRLRQQQIMMDRSEALALGKTVRDYTQVKIRLARGGERPRPGGGAALGLRAGLRPGVHQHGRRRPDAGLPGGDADPGMALRPAPAQGAETVPIRREEGRAGPAPGRRRGLRRLRPAPGPPGGRLGAVDVQGYGHVR